MVAHIIIESVAMVFAITIVGVLIGKLFKEAEKEDQEALIMISMTQLWMIGIIGLMAIFGISAGVYYKLGNKE